MKARDSCRELVNADETVLRKADQTIYHDRQHPSRVILPVIPN
jgi:hypothetical protein